MELYILHQPGGQPAESVLPITVKWWAGLTNRVVGMASPELPEYTDVRHEDAAVRTYTEWGIATTVAFPL